MKPDYNYFKQHIKMSKLDWWDFILFTAVVVVFIGLVIWSLI